jgi:hypothetical protein
MREFFEKLMSDDETQQKFTKYEMVVYGVLMPLGLVAVMVIAEWLESRAGL